MLSDVDKQQISAFLGSIVRGNAKLGLGALPMLKLYSAAQTEHVSMSELLVRDNATVVMLLDALKRRARDLPPSTLKTMEQILLLAHA